MSADKPRRYFPLTPNVAVFQPRHLAEFLGVKSSTLNAIVADPTFPRPIKLPGCGGLRRWLKPEIEAWLSQQPRFEDGQE